jgi:hypothetical protein
MTSSLNLELIPGTHSICRLSADTAVPAWALAPGQLASITRSRDELSIVCAEGLVPPGIRVEKGFRILKVKGTLDFSLTGILASIAVPLAHAKVSIFAISTYDTDYVLVPESKLEDAIKTLRAAGHEVETNPKP